MKRWLLITVLLLFAASPLCAQSVFEGSLAFEEVPMQQYRGVPDSAYAAWCSNNYAVSDTLVAIKEMHVTDQTMAPPCGTDAIVVRRLSCVIHYFEWLKWTMEKPPMVVALCPGHYATIIWPKTAYRERIS